MSFARPFNTRPLYQQVADEFIARIISGEWMQGQAIDNEADIARSLGVSVGTARKAFDILVDYKLLERQQGRGSVVPELSKGEGRARFSNIHDALGVRIAGAIAVSEASIDLPDERVAQLLGVNMRTPLLSFRRQRHHGERLFMSEQVFLRLRGDHHAPSDAAALHAMAEDRWHGFDIATSKTERVGTSAADERDSAVFGVAVGQPIMTLERIVRSYQQRPLELRFARCVLAPDLAYLAE